MRTIRLTKGYVTKLDSADFILFGKLKWSASVCKGGLVYAKTGGGSKRKILHRLILDAKDGQIVDHVNGDTLDNRRANLRLVTKWQSNTNQGKHGKGTSSIYKGVTTYGKKWGVHIRSEGKNIHLGLYDTEKDAALAYNVAAQFMHGQWARYNRVKVGPNWGELKEVK